MKLVLAWLVNFAWVFYAACGLGAIICVARALNLQRELGVSLTAFEREMTSRRAAHFWRLALVFALAGALLFLGHVYLLPRVGSLEPLPTPTPVGLTTPTPSPTPSATETGSLVVPTVTLAGVEPPPPPDLPTQTPVATAAPPTSSAVPVYSVNVRFGDVGELIGYDLAATDVRSNQTVSLVLYWRALSGAGALNYTVFTHLRSSDGRLIGQHDGAPAGGARPTTSWVAGEVIADFHQIAFTAEAVGYTGSGQIAVGLYNPAEPSSRVPVMGGGDYFILPTVINVLAP